MMLICKRCGDYRRVPRATLVDGVPLAQWFLSQGRLCTPCFDATVGAPDVQIGNNDSEVQVAGALLALPNSGTWRRKIYDEITKQGARGVTFDELGRSLNRTYSNNGPRVRELVQGGWVKDSGRTRTATSGAQQVVWIAAK